MEDIPSVKVLSEQIDKLKKTIASLKHPKELDPDVEPECVKWDLYEQSISDDPIAFMKAHLDSEETRIRKIKDKTLKELQGCLRFFSGERPMIRKARLLDFLRKFPGYRSDNLRLIEQRLYLTRKWMKENNFSTDKLEDLYELLKSGE